jgi:two-component system response regulator CpxR
MSDAKILLADDDEELCHLLSDFLVREGFTVDLAHDGENTLRLAAEGGYDALILDVMLPHRSGLDVLRTCAAGPRTVLIRTLART